MFGKPAGERQLWHRAERLERARRTMELNEAIGQKLLLSFEGTDSVPSEIVESIRQRKMAGVTLFRSRNILNPAQVRRLTEMLQAEAREAGALPLLVAADQEGGQLMAVGDATPFPGNMALGAARSEKLARETGRAIATELAAMGINVNYAPVCDVNSNPENPVIGIRSFGDDPVLASRLCAAMIEGIQSAGVAATAKHFPGHGDTSSDSHMGLPVVHHDRETSEKVDLPPFRAAVRSGARLVMTAHVAYPALTGRDDLPATLSPEILKGILRSEMDFRGVVVSDAMNMHAIAQGEPLWVDLVTAATAGIDLLLMAHELPVQAAAHTVLTQAVRRGLIPWDEILDSARRVQELRQWVPGVPRSPLDVVRSNAHMEIARRTAEQSVTLVKDDAGLVPLRPDPNDCIALVVPRPQNLTPADTSSYEKVALADAIRRRHPKVEEISVSFALTDTEIAGAKQRTKKCDLAIVGTINAFVEPRQVTLVKALLSTKTPAVVAALRLPYDLRAFPEVPTYVCTYSLQESAMEALAEALFGEIRFQGHLPVSL